MALINCPINVVARNNEKRLFAAQMGESNFAWLKYLTGEDYCIFSDGTGPATLEMIENILKAVPNRDNMFFLCNEKKVLRDRVEGGVPNPLFINQNAFIDENVFNIINGIRKEFDAIYNGRLRPVKRHFLAKEVGENYKLALLVGHHTSTVGNISETEVPNNVFRNQVHLKKPQVVELLNKSRVGLALSGAEGACFASSEYLLCGVPVVSTFCSGGRQEWYNDYNSIVTPPDPAAVNKAVAELLNNPRDPYEVRRSHLEMMYAHRQKFIDRIILQVFPELRSTSLADEVLSMFDVQSYLVFQGGGAWKKPEKAVELFETDGFEAGLNVANLLCL